MPPFTYKDSCSGTHLEEQRSAERALREERKGERAANPLADAPDVQRAAPPVAVDCLRVLWCLACKREPRHMLRARLRCLRTVTNANVATWHQYMALALAD
jgi:hypothetical protein